MAGVDLANIAARLVPLAGPPLKPIELRAKKGGLLIGRHECCDVRLTPETVSRFHARLWLDSDRWRLVDLNSRWGTYLNGCRLTPDRDVPLGNGDLIRITPWTFSLVSGPASTAGIDSFDDRQHAQTLVRTMADSPAQSFAEDLLSLLLESAAALHAAESEQALAQAILDASVRGTGLANGAVLRPLDGLGRVEIIAAHGAEGERLPYSRSLLSAASAGVVAELSQGQPASESIYRLQISTAICVPLMLGASVAAYLYLDSRGESQRAPHRLHANASAFCAAIGKMASLAWANLKRVDVERRQAALEAEVLAGAKAQRFILPPREGRIGDFAYIGESRPGRYMGGDFFDVIPLADERMAVALGDVAGKGVEASVLMTAAQGFLHAHLQEHGDPQRAVAELNRFICARRPLGKFITLWVGVFDGREHTLRYVDAGHGYAMIVRGDGSADLLSSGEGGLPIGIEQQSAYPVAGVELAPGERVLVISDGIVEQYSPADEGSVHKPFGDEGVMASLRECGPARDEVEAIFNAVLAHAAGPTLSDDATAVVVRFSPPA